MEGRWPFKNGSMILYCFQRAYKGVAQPELRKQTESSRFSWRIIMKALRKGGNNRHTWKLSEENNRLKIYDVKVNAN